MRSQLDRIFGEDESRDVTAATMGKFQKSKRRLKSQWPHQQEQKFQKNELRHIPSRDEK